MVATLEQIAQSALSSLETVVSSFDHAAMAIRNGVEGDCVECGVYAGAQCAAMALAIMTARAYASDANRQRALSMRVHLFDSFSGIPQAGAEDREYLEAGHKPGLSACSLAQVQRNMRAWGIDESLLVYHPGMFAETMSWASAMDHRYVRNIAVLRLDGDLYESTKTCLEHLYPLVSRGGWLIVDDFDLTGSRKAVMEYMGMRFGPGYFQKQAYNWPVNL